MNKSLLKNIKFILTLIILTGFVFFIDHSHVFAANPNAFIVEVQPSSFAVNEAVDLVVKAVNNGEIVKDYYGDVFIEVDGDINPQSEYVVPSEGFYSFLPQDQGIKIFSKGLLIKKAGTFKVVLSDITDESIRGEATIIVGSPGGGAGIENVQITSPVPGVIERNSTVNVFGISSNLQNSPVQYYLNDILVQQGLTDTVGSFNVYITGVNQGQNVLRVKIVDSNNTVLGESDQITFNYQPVTDETFKGIEIIPSSNIKQGDIVIFNVNVKDGVTSAQLKLSDGRIFPMDVVTVGKLSKTVTMEEEGDIRISLEITDLGIQKKYDNIEKLNVEKGVSIRNIRFYTDPIDKSILTIKREVIGIYPTKFKVDYGISSNLLDQSINVDVNEIVIENIDTSMIYFFRITPLSGDLTPIGTSGEIAKFDPTGPSCTVQNIIVYDEKIGDKYYLVRSGIENIEKYIIYRAEFETSDISQMKKVGETTDTRFEYPFNRFSQTDEYAFYVVQALCTDGTELMIDNVKKVQVGPVENMLMILIFSIFVYSIYRLYQYSK